MITYNDTQSAGIQRPGQDIPAVRERTLLRKTIAVFLLLAVVFGGVITASLTYKAGFQFSVQVGNQQSMLVDLRQSIPISPYLLGANVFPKTGTNSLDQADSGFMSYSTPIVNGLQSAHIKLLRFPGGNWGEQHAYSHSQLDAFSTLLNQTGASGILQVPLSSVVEQGSTLATRASNAALVVDYMNKKNSEQRAGQSAQTPFHPVLLWTVGNEPDRLINPDTGELYTVADYVTAFIQFSIAMHQDDPQISVFGPEISQFYGISAGPKDATGQLWMDGFLKGVSTYERQHPELHFHLLDGVSLHRYQFNNASHATTQLLNSTSEWQRTLPALHQLIRQDFQRDMPVAITEVNSNPNAAVPARNLAAVWWADTLGQLMSQQVAYVAFFSAEGVDTPYPLFSTNSLQGTPMLRVMQLFAHLQSNLVPLQTQSQAVSVYATQDEKGQTVSLLFINKSDSPQQAQIQSGTGLLPLGPWPQLHLNLGAYSMAVVTLHRNGGAEAYAYTTPTGAATTPALTYTTCGNAVSSATKTIAC